MRFPQSYVLLNYPSLTNVPITAVAGTTLAGPVVDSGLASITVGARVLTKCGTASLTIAAVKWQLLDNDGATWQDVVESNNPANVAFNPGSSTVTKFVSAPLAVTSGSRQARVVIITAGATGVGGATDNYTISYDIRAPVSVYGS